MNQKLNTFLAILLLCLFRATGVWAQENRQSVYSNNLQFLSGTPGYVGTGLQTYNVGSTTYTNGIKSFSGNGYRFPTVAFKVPVGTKYLHFHIFGDVANAKFTMKVGDATILENKILPYNSTIDSSTPKFDEGSGKQSYQRIILDEPLEANSIVEIASSATDASFLVFGVYYEDNLRPHKDTTAGNPFTASEAKALADDYIKLTDQVYVRGFVSKQGTDDAPSTFSISDDGSHTNEIQMVQANGISDKNKVLPRDIVTVYAEIATPTGRNLINGKVW